MNCRYSLHFGHNLSNDVCFLIFSKLKWISICRHLATYFYIKWIETKWVCYCCLLPGPAGQPYFSYGRPTCFRNKQSILGVPYLGTVFLFVQVIDKLRWMDTVFVSNVTIYRVFSMASLQFYILLHVNVEYIIWKNCSYRALPNCESYFLMTSNMRTDSSHFPAKFREQERNWNWEVAKRLSKTVLRLP